jgi:hypothetical protein
MREEIQIKEMILETKLNLLRIERENSEGR